MPALKSQAITGFTGFPPVQIRKGQGTGDRRQTDQQTGQRDGGKT